MKATILAHSSGKEYELTKNEIIFGRKSVSDIPIKNTFISRKHCRIYLKNNKYYIEDLHSLNGTFLNDMRITSPVELKDNDTFTLCYKGEAFQFKKYNDIQEKNIEQKKEFFLKKLFLDNDKKIKFLTLIISILVLIIIGMTLFINRKELYFFTIKDEVKKEFYKQMLKYGEKNFPMRDDFINNIKKYITYYSGSANYKEGLANRKKYIDMIENTFKKHFIPEDLSYIAFVESYYRPLSYNEISGARGMWQLMADTAREYGLVINKKIDERTDPVKSTEAAAAYINDLLSVFGVDSFTIALAAYNAGDGFLRSSLTKIKNPKQNRNFWYLYKNNLIPPETQEYVLKVIALMILDNNPDVLNKTK